MPESRSRSWADPSSPSRSTTPIGERGFRTAAGVVARSRVAYTFDGLNRLLSPLFPRPEDRLAVFVLLPADVQAACWDSLDAETRTTTALPTKEAITDNTSTQRTKTC
jgi:hypothetical protein